MRDEELNDLVGYHGDDPGEPVIAPAGSITLCPLGPLTNIAAAMIKAPKIVPRIGEIVLMGGGFFEGGNATPAATEPAATENQG